MNQTTHQMRLLGCESKTEFEEANSLALVKFMALEIEQKLQETNDWEELLAEKSDWGLKPTGFEEAFLGYVDSQNPLVEDKNKCTLSSVLLVLFKMNHKEQANTVV